MRNTAACALALMTLAVGPAFALDKLSLILGQHTPPLMNTLNLVAEGAGLYKEEGLDVVTTLVDNSTLALMTCASGKGDICPAAIEPLVNHYDEGVRMKMFLSRESKFGNVIAVPQDSPIKSFADLKGKTIGVHSASGSAGVFTTQSALSAAGLQPSDTKFVSIGMDKEAMGALTSGGVQAVGLPVYELVPFEMAGAKLRVFRHPVLADVANGGYAVAPSILATRADAIGRFSRAVVKSSLLIRYNPSAAARAMLKAQGKPMDEAEVKRLAGDLEAWQDDLPAFDPDSKRIGAMSQEGVQRYIQLLKDAGLSKRAIAASEVVTDQFIAFANDFDRKAFEQRAKAMK